MKYIVKKQYFRVQMWKKQCFLHDIGDAAKGLGRDKWKFVMMLYEDQVNNSTRQNGGVSIEHVDVCVIG